MTIKEWFYKAYPNKGHIISADLDFGRSTLYVVLKPSGGFHALLCEMNTAFMPDIEMLNDSSELGFMAVCCKNEEQVKQAIQSYMNYPNK